MSSGDQTATYPLLSFHRKRSWVCSKGSWAAGSASSPAGRICSKASEKAQELYSITRNKLPPGQITEPINAQANPIIGSGVAQPLATRYRAPVQTLSRIARTQPNVVFAPGQIANRRSRVALN